MVAEPILTIALLLTAAVPAALIFLWTTPDTSGDRKRRLRHAACGYCLCLLIGGALAQALATASPPHRALTDDSTPTERAATQRPAPDSWPASS